MPKASRYARVAITLPKPDLASADRLAQTLDRPRSWVIAEAVRRYAATALAAPSAQPALPPAQVLEGLGPFRLAQLTADLALTPEERVRAAEETLRVSELGRSPRAHSIRAFENYLDYLDFKRRRIDVR